MEKELQLRQQHFGAATQETTDPPKAKEPWHVVGACKNKKNKFVVHCAPLKAATIGC